MGSNSGCCYDDFDAFYSYFCFLFYYIDYVTMRCRWECELYERAVGLLGVWAYGCVGTAMGACPSTVPELNWSLTLWTAYQLANTCTVYDNQHQRQYRRHTATNTTKKAIMLSASTQRGDKRQSAPVIVIVVVVKNKVTRYLGCSLIIAQRIQFESSQGQTKLWCVCACGVAALALSRSRWTGGNGAHTLSNHALFCSHTLSFSLTVEL